MRHEKIVRLKNPSFFSLLPLFHALFCLGDPAVLLSLFSSHFSHPPHPHLRLQITIPSVFISMVGSDSLEAAAPALFAPTPRNGGSGGSASASASATATTTNVTLFARWRPFINLSSVLMWALGCATVFYASWASCDDVRRAKRRPGRGAYAAAASGAGGGDGDDVFRSDDDAAENEAPPLELEGSHAVGFILVASGVLLVLFYVDLYLLVTVLFCLSATTSVGQIAMRPCCGRLLGASAARHVVMNSELLGPITKLDCVSNGLGGGVAAVWFFTRYSWPTLAFLLQDLFGVCLCIVFLSTIRLPNLKVASLLLCMAFFYDVFFVFISPLIFHESVMVKVATGK